MNHNIVDHRVLEALRGRGYTDEKIALMSPEDRFREYCGWRFGDPLWGDILLSIWKGCNR